MRGFRVAAETLARRTTRRGLFGRGAEVAFGALAGAAAGTLTRPQGARAGLTVCDFPGPPCPCDRCQSNGVCAKPCVINTTYWASGCWVTVGVTCCDCDCAPGPGDALCGCGSDYHNDPAHCPKGNASS
jgi:hypothetical protein